MNIPEETLAAGLVACALIRPATDAALAVTDRVAKARAAKATARSAALRESLHQAAAAVPSSPGSPSITRYPAGPAAGDSPAGPADANLTMTAAERAERREAVLAARAAGLTWAQVGAELGMTSQTVRGVARRSAASNGAAS